MRDNPPPRQPPPSLHPFHQLGMDPELGSLECSQFAPAHCLPTVAAGPGLHMKAEGRSWRVGRDPKLRASPLNDSRPLFNEPARPLRLPTRSWADRGVAPQLNLSRQGGGYLGNHLSCASSSERGLLASGPTSLQAPSAIRRFAARVARRHQANSASAYTIIDRTRSRRHSAGSTAAIGSFR